MQARTIKEPGQDFLAVITVFGTRLHGLRPYKKAIKMLLSKKIRLKVSEQDAVALEVMQGKSRGLYN
jgi:hypothetical protein